MSASVGDALGNSGECPVVTWRGKPYRVAFATDRTLARLEILVAAAATAEAEELAAALPPEQGEAQRKAVRSMLAGKAHRAGGSLWADVLNGPDGPVLQLLAFLRHHHPGASHADAGAMIAEEPAQVEAALAVVSPDFFRIAGRAAKSDPALLEESIRRREQILAARRGATTTGPTSTP